MFRRVYSNLRHFFIIPIFLGTIGGFSALLFRKLISLFNEGFSLFFGAPHYYPLIIPLIFLFSYFVSKKLLVSAENVTIDEIAKKIALERGGFNPKKGLLILILTSFNIGFGVPVGREGPIAKLGGVFSEFFSKLLRVDGLHFPIYLTCGVSSALSATFNAPVAAVLFGAEVVLGKINSYILIPLIVSSTTATVIARYFLGDFRAFVVPHLTYKTDELLLYPFISLFAAISIYAISSALRFFAFLRSSLRDYWHFAVLICGLLVGFLLWHVPQASGVGYSYITELFKGSYSTESAGEIAFVKALAVVLTFGSGVFGGFMAPSIFIGAFGGYSIGSFLTNDPGSFALSGAAAFLTGISGAPLRSSLVILELTHSYQLMVPVLFTSALTNYFLGAISQASFFKRALFHKGIDLEEVILREELKLKDFLVFIKPVNENSSVSELKKRFLLESERYIPVVNERGELVGIVSPRDLSLTAFYGEELKVKDVMTSEPFYILENSPLSELIKAISLIERGKLPVVDKKKRYLGMFDCDRFIRALTFKA
ncbi:chloride channel protein [Thermovibrio sp.]